MTKEGGHPGNLTTQSSIRRWVAPRDGILTIRGSFKHPSEHGDGLLGYIVSSQHGLLAEYAVKTNQADTNLSDISVKQGDTLDFVASPGPTTSHDSYTWSLEISMDRPEGSLGESVQTAWKSRDDFAGPAPEGPKPLSAWAQFAQVLLLTNEFMYVD